MNGLFAYYPLLILILPLAAALLTSRPARFVGETAYRLGVLAHLAAMGIAIRVLYVVSTAGGGALGYRLFASPWSGLPRYEISIDRLAAVMMVLITGIGTLIYLYAVNYMRQDRGRARFHTLLALAVFVLLCMVSSANLLMLFLFWQLLSWLLCLLAYNHVHPPTVQGSFRTFVALRLGDVAFLAGIALAYGLYGTLDFHGLFVRAAADPTTFSLLWPGSGLEIRGATAVALLIFIGAMSKSAQFPLHLWLPDSLYAPTPVHALLHAGIINAGGFLLNRLAPLYGLSPAALHIVFAAGLLTALLGASMMLTQNDIKKTLGYSTIGQMGYMIMECGLGAFALAVFHLIAHGLFKATIFLNCGNVIHAARRDPRLPHSAAIAAESEADPEFSLLTWLTGFLTTLILPLIIMLAAHGVLNIAFRDSQGVVIFLFFSWVTSSQAILTLYRIRAVSSPKVAGLMLLTLLLVVSTYLLAAEAFTSFLYPAPGEVSAYFRAAALPSGLFDIIVGATSLSIIFGWTLIYAKSHGRSFRMPAWVGKLQVRAYLFFMNRLYLDGLLLRLGRGFSRLGRRLESGPLFPIVFGIAALAAASPFLIRAAGGAAGPLLLLLPLAFLLPLFPLHGAYTAVLKRLPGAAPVWLAVLMPAAGWIGVSRVLSSLPPAILPGLRLLALAGALYGSVRALSQNRLRPLSAYAGLSLYSILWWHLASTGRASSHAAVFAASATAIVAGLLLFWNRLRVRYGGPDPDRYGGLFGPMPRFAVLMALLVMAAAGLPPFGLFSGYMEMLLGPAAAIRGANSLALSVILFAWLSASWYLFRMMQRILFGPHRPDLVYEDAGAGEVLPLLAVLVVLLALGFLPKGLLETGRMQNVLQTAMEWNPWNR
jgi:NADH-quinone oxidoreductase subunit L